MIALADFPIEAHLYQGERIRVDQLAHGIVRLVLTRAELRNAFDGVMIGELSHNLEALAGMPGDALRLLLLDGEGEVFCAGADLGYMRTLATASMAQNVAEARSLAQLFHRLASFPVPVLAAIRGAAIGGGLGLAACVDIVVAEAQTVFATTEVRLGIVPGVISPYVLRKLGVSRGGELMLTGRRISGEEAQALGLVHHLVSVPSNFGTRLSEVILECLLAGPEAARRTKGLLLQGVPLPDEGLTEFTISAIAEARASAEGQAGLSAFLEKQPAPWRAGLPQGAGRP